MSEFFNRDIRVTVKDIQISSRNSENDVTRPTLRMDFSVEKGLNKAPNTADLVIYNLSKRSRSALQEKKVAVRIEAGYVGTLQQLFLGNVRFAGHTRQGTNWISRFQAGDGDDKIRVSRVSLSFKPGTKIEDIFSKIADSLGLPAGVALDKVKEGNFRGLLTEMKKGFTASGNAYDELDRFIRSLGLELSVQDGKTTVTTPGKALKGPAVVLSSSTGLVGVPEIGEKGIVKARSLLQGLLAPGRQVNIKSRTTEGFFRIQKTTHTGITAGSDWYTDIECEPLQ